MENFIEGPIGLIHTIMACVALVSGAIVLSGKKGTKKHRQYGYLYAVSMVILNLTAIPITNMTGELGVFHFFIVISLSTITAATIIPIFFRQYEKWLEMHLTFMFWSYIGLISAFIAEVIIRLPSIIILAGVPQADVPTGTSYWLLGIILFVTMGIGEYFFRRFRKRWLASI